MFMIYTYFVSDDSYDILWSYLLLFTIIIIIVISFIDYDDSDK